MRYALRRLALATLAMGLLAPLSLCAAQLIGISHDQRQLRVIDPNTGSSVLLFETGIEGNVAGLGSDPAGNLYVLTTGDADLAASGFQNSLLQIDRNTGTPSLVTAFESFGEVTDVPRFFEGGLAYDNGTGHLFGLQQFDSESFLRQLFTIDLLSGEAALIGGLTDDEDYSALTFLPNGDLLALETDNDQLLQLDPTNAQILGTTNLSVALGETAGMAVDPFTGNIIVVDGGLGSTDAVYILNPLTGELELVGPSGIVNGYSGLTYLIPEPSTAFYLVGIALIAGGRRRRAPGIRERCG